MVVLGRRLARRVPKNMKEKRKESSDWFHFITIGRTISLCSVARTAES